MLVRRVVQLLCCKVVVCLSAGDVVIIWLVLLHHVVYCHRYFYIGSYHEANEDPCYSKLWRNGKNHTANDTPCIRGQNKIEAPELERDLADGSKTTESVIVVEEESNDILCTETVHTGKSGKYMIKETPDIEIIKEHCDKIVPNITQDRVKERSCAESVENSSVTNTSKRRSKIRALPSCISKRKMVKKEDASQESSHTQSLPTVEEVEIVQSDIECLDSYNEEPKKNRSAASLRSNSPSNISSFSLTNNQAKEHHDQVASNPTHHTKVDINKENTVTGIGVPTADNNSAANGCKRRSKIKAMPSLFKRKTIKNESTTQASDHNSETLSIIGKCEKQAIVPCGKSRKQELKKFESPHCSLLRPDEPPTKYSSNITCDKDADNEDVTVEFSHEKETASKFVSESKRDVNNGNIEQVAHTAFEKKNHEARKRKISSSIAEEKEGENSELGRLKFKKKIIEQDHDTVISDDSSGDKENSIKVTATHRHIKKENDSKEEKSQSSQKRKENQPKESSSKKLPVLSRSGRKLKPEIKTEKLYDDDSDERPEKQLFRERKQEYRKKVSRGGLEPSKMTMFDLIFWNPANNPMPGRTDTPRKRLSISSKNETESIISEVNEEQRIEDLGLDTSDPVPGSSPVNVEDVDTCQKTPPDTVDLEIADDKNTNDEENLNEEDGDIKANEDIFAPRVKIGPNGQIIVDEQSIKIQTTAAKNRDEILSKAEVVEESSDTLHYGKWSKKRPRSSEWTLKETARFYKALSTVGTDFSMMEALITWRSRAELKTKFKKEERINRELVDRALRDSTQFDVSIFDEESDYDPEEDRKASRQAEREEAKQRRLEMKQSEKAMEVKQKRLEKSKIRSQNKKRKKLLRRAHKEQKNKKMLECSEDEIPLESRRKVKKTRIKKHKPERRNSFVIDEVTVTWECSLPSQSNSEQIIEQTIEENCGDLTEDPIQFENVPSQSVESDNENTVERVSPILPAPDGQIIVSSVSSPKNDLSGSSPNVQDDIESNVLPDSYTADQTLPEDIITEGTAVEDRPKTDASNANESDVLHEHSMEECTTGKSFTGKKCEAQKEALQSGPSSKASLLEAASDGMRKMWHFPVSAIQTQDDGQQVIIVPTSSGQYRVPVPVLPPGTSNIVVMATPVADNPGEYIYHVYVMSPTDEDEQQSESVQVSN
ncbi:hypothetical protein Pmani_018668 [Petrolisthes manimaculis]|uniref:Transcription factor TFIIIB component B'' Myb domain-containing protein n=1 Tax=Petrolisthes manimaculis TaxID=1843537 RepID=A0AAE1U866_9EUCA|nr:hypothetical protein Pmani_018668 [Petrolisthes manimaculis]